MLVMPTGKMNDVCELVLWELFVLYEVLNHSVPINLDSAPLARATCERDRYLPPCVRVSVFVFCYGWYVYHTDTVSVCFWECLYTSVCVCVYFRHPLVHDSRVRQEHCLSLEERERLWNGPAFLCLFFSLPLFPSFPLSGFSSVCHSLRAQYLSWTLFLRTDWRLYQNLCPMCPSFFQCQKQSELNSLSSCWVFQHKNLRLIHKVPRPSSGPVIQLNLTLNVLKYCASVFK